MTTGGSNPPTLINSAFAENFNAPKVFNVKQLVNYVISNQLKMFGEVYPLPYGVTLKNFNKLVKKYGMDMTLRGTYQAFGVAEHTFSTVLVEKMIEQIQKEQSLCQSMTLKKSENNTTPNKFCGISE